MFNIIILSFLAFFYFVCNNSSCHKSVFLNGIFLTFLEKEKDTKNPLHLLVELEFS